MDVDLRTFSIRKDFTVLESEESTAKSKNSVVRTVEEFDFRLSHVGS